MERRIWFEGVASGKMDDYKVWFEARDRRFQELGIPRPKMYRVQSRAHRMVCIVSPEVTPEELEQWYAKASADERILELVRETREKKVLIDGTMEAFRLTEA